MHDDDFPSQGEGAFTTASHAYIPVKHDKLAEVVATPTAAHPHSEKAGARCEPTTPEWGRTPTPAYWPLPRVSRASVACRLIDSRLGYPTQTYAVRTVDGYILTLVRIPRPESSKVAFFQHGLLDSASAWVSTGDKFSLAARAYSEGYDVYLGNLRGSNDSLRENGIGAHPSDYLEADDASPSSSSTSAGASSGSNGVHSCGKMEQPLRGRSARARSIDFSSAAAAAQSPHYHVASAGVNVRFIGSSSDGIPVHETLHPRQRAYWAFNVQDHALDLMAFMRHIRVIKALEGPQRRYLQKLAEEKRGQQRDGQGSRCHAAAASVPPASRAAGPPQHPQPATRLRSHMRSSFGLDAAAGSASDGSAPAPPAAQTDGNDSGSSGARHLSPLRRSDSAPSPHELRAAAAEASGSSGDSGAGTGLDLASGAPDAAAATAADGPQSPAAGTCAPATLAAPQPPHIDATSADADDVEIVGVGHSMGGAVLLLYIILCRALRRPHWMDRMVLLSPAGLHSHMNAVPLAILRIMRWSGALRKPAPFPARNSTLERMGASFMQELKRVQSADTVISALAARVFGGTASNWVFRHGAVSYRDYPVGGSGSVVVQHGLETMQRRDFVAFNYGPDENRRRYGSPVSPSYRIDYGLFDVPCHIVAGGKDVLIPVANLEAQFGLLALMRPRGQVTMREIEDAGHLDFTLTLSDAAVSHVLREMGRVHAAKPAVITGAAVASTPARQSGTHCSASALATPASPSVLLRRIAPVEHETLAESDEVPPSPAPPTAAPPGGSAEALPTAEAHDDDGADTLPAGHRVTLADLPPAVAAEIRHVAQAALAKNAAGYHAGELAPHPQWWPFPQQAGRYPFLRGFTKLDLVAAGLDAEAHEMALPGAVTITRGNAA